MSNIPRENPQAFKPGYLGDAVYASFDGYQVWLHLNRHDNEPLIALEPQVMEALVRYAKIVGVLP